MSTIAASAPARHGGVVLVDKPGGWTSHDVVARLRRMYGTRRVGHAGTLDPMATGLLLVGVGPATRLLTFFVGLDKVYTATVRLGQATSTDDAEGEITATADRGRVQALSAESIAVAAAEFTGDIMQIPSSVSAIKVDGVRSYARVRSGEDVALPARPVTVTAFEIVSAPRRVDDSLDVDIRVSCSSGTYIRALARDLGAALGVGGHLVALRRESIGAFSVTEAHRLPARDESWEHTTGLLFPALTMAAAAKRVFPVRMLDAADAARARYGQPLSENPSAELTAALDPDGDLVAMVRNDHGRAKPAMVVSAVAGAAR